MNYKIYCHSNQCYAVKKLGPKGPRFLWRHNTGFRDSKFYNSPINPIILYIFWELISKCYMHFANFPSYALRIWHESCSKIVQCLHVTSISASLSFHTSDRHLPHTFMVWAINPGISQLGGNNHYLHCDSLHCFIAGETLTNAL